MPSTASWTAFVRFSACFTPLRPVVEGWTWAAWTAAKTPGASADNRSGILVGSVSQQAQALFPQGVVRNRGWNRQFVTYVPGLRSSMSISVCRVYVVLSLL